MRIVDLFNYPFPLTLLKTGVPSDPLAICSLNDVILLLSMIKLELTAEQARYAVLHVSERIQDFLIDFMIDYL